MPAIRATLAEIVATGALASGPNAGPVYDELGRLHVAPSGASGAATSGRVARAVHLASAPLPAAGAWTSQTAYTIPVGVRAVSFIVTYTRGAVGGQARHRIVVGNGTETADVLLIDPVIVTTQPYGAQAAYGQVINGPIPADGSAYSYEVTIPITSGWTTIALLMAEIGITGTPGTGAIALTAGY